MKPIFDRYGRTVGWQNDSSIIDRHNSCRAFIRNNSVFSYNGQYLGVFENKYFRDRYGYCVAFMAGATKGPITPIHEIPLIPPIPPILPIPPVPPIPPIGMFNWSDLD